MPNDNPVEHFYDENALKEWVRLDRHRTELALTLKAMEEYLPPAPANIIDIGGGPGRYAIELTQKGYTVTLLDLSRANLDLAVVKASETKTNLEAVIHADALSLDPFAENLFDAVLLMGPLYHLITLEDRLQAIREAKRVLKPGGVLFAVFISRYGVFLDASAKYPQQVFENQAEWQQLWQDGINRSGFTDAYFAMPDEIMPFMENQGFTTLNLLGLEGIVAGHEDMVNVLTGEAWDFWVKINYSYAKDPALHAASNHLLYVGRKTTNSE